MILRTHPRIADIPAAAWDALDQGGSPFLEHRWLQLLEDSGAAQPDEGWTPAHLGLWDEGRLLAAAPTWLKTHSMGEFVYDWSWAGAARQLGCAYYPKVVVGVPFTPAAGPRLLVAPGVDAGAARALLVRGLHSLREQVRGGGVHVLFNPEDEALALEDHGAATRLQYQFQWKDAGYGDWEGFLASFNHKRRKTLKRERRAVAESALSVRVLEGEDLRPEHLDAMYGFYRRTAARFGGWAYLPRAWWEGALERLRDLVVLVMAFDGPRPVAGAFNVRKGERMYGRYWGAVEERPFLHFEVCYYQAIDYALRHGVRVFEPGHGGEHKYPRGFGPQLCWSSHWLADARLDGAVRRHLTQERAAVLAEVAALSGEGAEEAG